MHVTIRSAVAAAYQRQSMQTRSKLAKAMTVAASMHIAACRQAAAVGIMTNARLLHDVSRGMGGPVQAHMHMHLRALPPMEITHKRTSLYMGSASW